MMLVACTPVCKEKEELRSMPTYDLLTGWSVGHGLGHTAYLLIMPSCQKTIMAHNMPIRERMCTG
eukprot:1160095-Pelagomonas_calceolata.AAC.3